MDPISKFRSKPLIDEVPEKQTTEGTPAEALKVSSAGIANTPDAFVIQDPARLSNIPMKELKISSELPQAETVDASSIFSQEPHAPETPHFQEDVTPATTLPDGSAIVRELSDIIGDLKINTDPSHYGIDLSKGGISARDLIGKVLGITDQSSVTPSGGLSALPGTALKADGIIDWIVNFFKEVAKHHAPLGTGDLLDAPELVEEVTGDATNLLRGVKAFGTDDSGNALLNKVDEGSKYTNPEGGPTPDIILTPEQAMKILELLKNINVKPENADGTAPAINAEDLEGASLPSPFGPHVNPGVVDRNPDLQENVSVLSAEQLAARRAATGGDPINPLDPDLAPQSPPSELPEAPKGPDDTGNPG